MFKLKGPKEKEQVNFSQIEDLEDKFFINFHQLQEDKQDAHKPESSPAGENFKRKLFQKLGIHPNKTNGFISEFGNKIWEIKKRLNIHFAYLKKKMFFEKIDELFIQVIVENNLIKNKQWVLKNGKKKIKNILVYLKPFIFSNITSNNMLMDGIKLLFLTKKQSSNDFGKKLKFLLKKIKMTLLNIIIDSINNFNKKNKHNIHFIELFPSYFLDNQNLGKDKFNKLKSNKSYGKEDNEFSDSNLRLKNGYQIKSFDFGLKNTSNAFSKTNMNYPNTKKKNFENFENNQPLTQAINIDKICFYYLDRLNITGKYIFFFFKQDFVRKKKRILSILFDSYSRPFRI